VRPLLRASFSLPTPYKEILPIRHAVYQTRCCPQRLHTSTWPPRTAVRQDSIDLITRRRAVDNTVLNF